MTLERQHHTTPEGDFHSYAAPFAHPALRQRAPHRAVARYGYEEAAHGSIERHEPATPRIVLIVEVGPPIEVGPAGLATRHPGGFVAGLVDSPTRTWHAGRQAGVQLDLDPLTAGRLLGLPLHELAGGVHTLDAVLDASERPLLRRLRETVDWTCRLALVDDWLARRLSDERAPSSEFARIAWALDRLDKTRGSERIGALTSALGWSERRLQRAFERYVGIAPKRYARIARFAALRAALQAGQIQSWAAAAAAFGYADQSHLSREVQRMTGMAPSIWAVRPQPSIATT